MNHQEKSERDELRARFTGWLEVTLYRAKLNYVKRQEREKGMVYVDAFPEELWVSENPERNWIQGITEPGAFQFEEERLEKAFHTLSEQRRRYWPCFLWRNGHRRRLPVRWTVPCSMCINSVPRH